MLHDNLGLSWPLCLVMQGRAGGGHLSGAAIQHNQTLLNMRLLQEYFASRRHFRRERALAAFQGNCLRLHTPICAVAVQNAGIWVALLRVRRARDVKNLHSRRHTLCRV